MWSPRLSPSPRPHAPRKFYIPDVPDTSDSDSMFLQNLSPELSSTGLTGESAEDMLKAFQRTGSDLSSGSKDSNMSPDETKNPSSKSEAEKMLHAFQAESSIQVQSSKDLRDDLEKEAEKRKEGKESFEHHQSPGEAGTRASLQELNEAAAQWRPFEPSYECELTSLRKKQLQEQQEAVEQYTSDWKAEKEALLQAWQDDHERLQQMIELSTEASSTPALQIHTIGMLEFKPLANTTPEIIQLRNEPETSPPSSPTPSANRAPSISPASAARPPKKKSVSRSPRPMLSPPPATVRTAGSTAVLDSKGLVRAHKKFVQMDVDGNGVLEGAELVLLAQWVWSSFHPGGVPLSSQEQKAESEKLLRRLDEDGDRRMSFEEFSGWFERTCTSIQKFRRGLAQRSSSPVPLKVDAVFEADADPDNNELWIKPQLFECMVPHPGVGYRFSVSFTDKNPDGKGPKSTSSAGNPKHWQVIGNQFKKSAEGVTFLKCATGRGWLPLSNPAGTVRCFKHLGSVPGTVPVKEGSEVDAEDKAAKATVKEGTSSGADMYKQYAQEAEAAGRAALPTKSAEDKAAKKEGTSSGADMYKQYAQEAEAAGRAALPTKSAEDKASKVEVVGKYNSEVSIADSKAAPAAESTFVVPALQRPPKPNTKRSSSESNPGSVGGPLF